MIAKSLNKLNPKRKLYGEQPDDDKLYLNTNFREDIPLILYYIILI